MTFANQTPFAALPVPLLDAAGNDVLVAIVKATFAIDAKGAARLAGKPSPIRVADELHDPGSPQSSIRYPTDIGVAKLGTDVVVVGDAISPVPVKVLDIAIKVKERLVPLRVHGPRVFFEGAFGVAIGPAQPFERVPVTYERAYGGVSEDLSVVEPRNPSGVGVAKRTSDLVGRRAPQIEHPARPHTSASDRHPPAGFGAIMTHWSPRLERAGTLDERWQATRMPLLPEDYDVRFGNVAHPSLQFEEHLEARDLIGVQGMSPAPLVFPIPALGVAVTGLYDTGERMTVRPPIDTILIEPEARRVEVVARAVLFIGRGKRVLRELVVRSDDENER